MADSLPTPPVPPRQFVSDGQKIHRCRECRQPMRYDTDYYMLRHTVWAQAIGARPETQYAPGYLHLACVEKRIGRQLHLDDFMPEVPINFGAFGFDARIACGARGAA